MKTLIRPCVAMVLLAAFVGPAVAQTEQRQQQEQERQAESARHAAESARQAEELNRQYQQSQAEYQQRLVQQQQDDLFRQQQEEQQRGETPRREELYQAQQAAQQQQADPDWQARVNALAQPPQNVAPSGGGNPAFLQVPMAFPRAPRMVAPLNAAQQWQARQEQNFQAIRWQAQMRFEAARQMQMRQNGFVLRPAFIR